MAEQFDAIVIGSGFGGAVTACRLAQGGLRLLVLERGRRFESGDFPDLPSGGVTLPDGEGWSYAADGGLWDVQDLGPVVSAQAAGYGGGSLIYANVHLRPPPDAFHAWPAPYDAESLAEYYDLAAWMLDVAPIDAHEAAGASSAKTAAFDATAHALGRTPATFHPPLAISYRDHTNAFGARMRACTGCGRCCTGCPHEAKSSLDRNYLAALEALPRVCVKTRCEATTVHAKPDGYTIDYVDELAGFTPREASARYLFVCAGTLGTLKLLARSRAASARGPGQGLPNLGARLGHGYSGNADAVSLVFGARDQHAPTRGPTITSSVVHRDDDGHFLLVQDGGYPPELAAVAAMFASPLWLGKNRHRGEGGPPADRVLEADGELRPPVDGGVESFAGSLAGAARAGAFARALPPQLAAALRALREEVVSNTRPEFERAVDRLVEQAVSSFLARVSRGRIVQGTRVHTELSRWATRFANAHLADRHALVTRAQALPGTFRCARPGRRARARAPENAGVRDARPRPLGGVAHHGPCAVGVVARLRPCDRCGPLRRRLAARASRDGHGRASRPGFRRGDGRGAAHQSDVRRAGQAHHRA